MKYLSAFIFLSHSVVSFAFENNDLVESIKADLRLSGLQATKENAPDILNPQIRSVVKNILDYCSGGKLYTHYGEYYLVPEVKRKNNAKLLKAKAENFSAKESDINKKIEQLELKIKFLPKNATEKREEEKKKLGDLQIQLKNDLSELRTLERSLAKYGVYLVPFPAGPCEYVRIAYKEANEVASIKIWMRKPIEIINKRKKIMRNYVSVYDPDGASTPWDQDILLNSDKEAEKILLNPDLELNGVEGRILSQRIRAGVALQINIKPPSYPKPIEKSAKEGEKAQ